MLIKTNIKILSLEELDKEKQSCFQRSWKKKNKPTLTGNSEEILTQSLSYDNKSEYMMLIQPLGTTKNSSFT